MAKTDVDAAFRLLPVHPRQFSPVEMPVAGCILCSISCSLFETFSSFVEWVVRDVSGINSIIQYLDDFLCVAPPDSRSCRILLAALQHISDRFGIPLALDKMVVQVVEISFFSH